jgi:hypothetical protein
MNLRGIWVLIVFSCLPYNVVISQEFNPILCYTSLWSLIMSGQFSP